MSNGFPREVQKQLGSYVYRLIDPRNGETFYVGRGVGDRVFQHVMAKLKEDPAKHDGMSLKKRRIQSIINQMGEGSVIHVIHRHGLTDEQARIVEAAVIDAYTGLTNEIGGEGSSDFGPAHADELIKRYRTEPFQIGKGHKLLLITINRTFDQDNRSVFNATRAAWRINKRRAEQADAILGVAFGIVRGAYVADDWVKATREEFPFLEEDMENRKGFHGGPAEAEIQKRYVGFRVPESLLNKPGARGPLRYNYD